MGISFCYLVRSFLNLHIIFCCCWCCFCCCCFDLCCNSRCIFIFIFSFVLYIIVSVLKFFFFFFDSFFLFVPSFSFIRVNCFLSLLRIVLHNIIIFVYNFFCIPFVDFYVIWIGGFASYSFLHFFYLIINPCIYRHLVEFME